MKVPLVFRIACLLLALVSLARADWIYSSATGDVAYFLNNAPARLDRYDLKARQWLAPVSLPSARGVPTAAFLDRQGVYVAYARAVYRYNLDGTGEVQLMNAASDVTAIVANGTHIFVHHPGTADLTSIAKATNTIVESKDFWYTMVGLSMSPDGSAIFGRSSNVSPSDIERIPVNADGTMGTQVDSPHHGDYPSGTKTWVFPNGARVVDSSGTVYLSDTLRYTLSFGGAINDLEFLGSDVPIVLRGAELVSYTNSLLPAGSKTLTYTPKKIYLQGSDVLTFTPDNAQANGIRVEAVALSNLTPPEPGVAVNPVGLPFTPDETFLDKNGTLYLFSKAHQSIFRWDPTQQKYLGTIALIGAPEYVAYSADNHTIYLAYASGLIRKMNLGAATLSEEAFATLPMAPLGLAAAGAYVFASDSSGAWNTHYTFTPTGTLVESVDWNYYSKEYIWSPQNQKMYFFRDDTSPNDLLSEEINANGTAYPAEPPGGIGAYKDSPLHDSTGFTHPIRVSPDGSIVVLGSGVIHAANTLARLTTSLGNAINDVAWLGSEPRTIRTVTNVTQFQQWTGPTYAQGLIKQVPGTAHRLLTLSADRLLGITLLNGIPSFYILNSNFEVVPPAQLEAPTGLSAAVTSTTKVTLSWKDVSGEAEYVIQRRLGSDGIWEEVGMTATGVVTFDDSGFTPGSSYSYRVAARNGVLMSPFSSELTVLLAAPAAPAGVTAAKQGSQQIVVQWADATNESGYQIDRKIGANGTWSQIATPAAGQTSYTSTGLTPGTQYFYRVRAINAFGSSPNSAEVNATTDPVPPSAPSYLQASASNSFTVYVSWGSVSYEEKFILERQQGSSGVWTEIATPVADSTGYSDTGVQPLTAYSYRIKAVNSAGESAYSPVANVTTPQITPPAAPTGFVARPESATTVQISWINVSFETGYVLQRRGDDPNSWTNIATLPVDSTKYVDSGLTTGVQYFYRVLAYNAGGNSAYSGVDDAIPVALVSWLEDDFNDGLGSVWSSVSGGIVFGSGAGFRGSSALWFGDAGVRSATTLSVDTMQGGFVEFLVRAGNSTVDGTEFWDNSETGETLVLEYSVNGGAWTSLQTLNTVYPGYATWTPVSVELPAGARSESTRFRWRQLSNSGPASDTWALEDVRIRAVLPPVPLAPAVVFAMANSSSTASLLWSPVTGATSYVVEQLIAEQWTAIASVTSEVTSYRVNGLAADTIYAFRVRAGNVAGLSSESQLSLVRTWAATDDPSKGTLSFVSRNVSATETSEGGTATLIVQRAGAAAGEVSVGYTVTSGSATSGEDFVAASGTLTFASGQNSQAITVQLLPDLLVEPTETFTVTLSNATGGAELGVVTTATVSIADDDHPGVVAFASATSTAAEDAGTHSINVVRTDGATGPVSVLYAITGGSATAGQDYVLSAGTLEFANGETSKTISVEINDDAEPENMETCTLVLSNPTGSASIGAISEHTFSIQDDEPFAPRNASYVGLLFVPETQSPAGFVRFKTTTTGRVTGKISVDGISRAFTGQLDQDGRFVATFGGTPTAKAKRLAPVELIVDLDALGDEFEVQYKATDTVLEGEGERLLSGDESDAGVMAGNYTALLRSGPSVSQDQAVRAIARITISSRAVVTVNGYAPDGRAFAFTTGITVQGRIPLGVQLNSQDGLFGWLEAESEASARRIQGNVEWITTWAETDSPNTGAGVPLQVEARPYVVPVASEPPFVASLGDTTAGFAISSDALSSIGEIAIKLEGGSKVVGGVPKGNRVTLKVNRKTGFLDGTFTPAGGQRWKLRGVILQAEPGTAATVEGAAIAPNALGWWSISPAEVK